MNGFLCIAFDQTEYIIWFNYTTAYTLNNTSSENKSNFKTMKKRKYCKKDNLIINGINS